MRPNKFAQPKTSAAARSRLGSGFVQPGAGADAGEREAIPVASDGRRRSPASLSFVVRKQGISRLMVVVLEFIAFGIGLLFRHMLWGLLAGFITFGIVRLIWKKSIVQSFLVPFFLVLAVGTWLGIRGMVTTQMVDFSNANTIEASLQKIKTSSAEITDATNRVALLPLLGIMIGVIACTLSRRKTLIWGLSAIMLGAVLGYLGFVHAALMSAEPRSTGKVQGTAAPIPAGWITHTTHGIRIATPSHWQLGEPGVGGSIWVALPSFSSEGNVVIRMISMPKSPNFAAETKDTFRRDFLSTSGWAYRDMEIIRFDNKSKISGVPSVRLSYRATTVAGKPVAGIFVIFWHDESLYSLHGEFRSLEWEDYEVLWDVAETLHIESATSARK